MISHNIIYTAITRAKEDLKIYCTPEVKKMLPYVLRIIERLRRVEWKTN